MKEKNRSGLMAAATQLFAERGLNGVSTRDLAAAAQVSLKDIAACGDKEGLYAAVLKEQFSCYEYIEAIRQMELDPLGKIREYISWVIKRHRSNPNLIKFYSSELSNPTPYYRAIVQPAVSRAIIFLMETINEGVLLKQFRKGLNPVDTVLAVVGMINYYFLSTVATQEVVNRSPERDDMLLQHYMDLLTKGILA